MLAGAVARIHEIDFGLPLNDHPDESVIIAKPLSEKAPKINRKKIIYF